MSSHYTETQRGGAAAPTGFNDQALLITPPNERITMGSAGIISKMEGALPSSGTGGGHRGEFQRFGNDEVKPNNMNEDAKWNDRNIENADRTDGVSDMTQQNACKEE